MVYTPTVNIITIILENILKIDPYTIAQYSSISDQLIYLILIPNVILFLFVWSFGYWVVPHHTGMRLLMSLTAYIFIVYIGWYGALVPIFIPWFTILVGGMLLFFIVSKILHPGAIAPASGLIGEIGKKVRGSGAPRKEAEKIEEEIKKIDKKIKILKGMPHDPYTIHEINQLTAMKAELEHELEKL